MKKAHQADKRVKFIWQDLASFKTKWRNEPVEYSKDIIIVDEGDLLLEKGISKIKAALWPRHIFLLSALPKASWTGI